MRSPLYAFRSTPRRRATKLRAQRETRPRRGLRWIVTLMMIGAAVYACDPSPESMPADAGVPDSGPRERTRETLPDPEPLRAGIAETTVPAPIGIGSTGNSYFGTPPRPTPFNDRIPGTNRQHGELTFRAVALSRGAAFEVVIVRADTIGVFQQLREAVLDEVEARIGRRLDDSLVLAANHTHSGPGRVLLTEGALASITDTFFAEFYDRMVDAIATAVEEALGDLAPAELGLTMTENAEAHKDRRCENDGLDQVQEVPDMPLIAVRRDGVLDAIVASYAYHGTAIGFDALTLSGDVGAVVEQKIAERYDHPVAVLFLNSWGGDMAPDAPDHAPDSDGADLPDDFDLTERVGDVIADTIVPAIESMTFDTDLTIRARTYRIPIDRETMGYAEDVWEYPFGAAFCGLGRADTCPATRDESLAEACIPISRRDGLPRQTLVTAGQIGDLPFVTGAGEWGTALANGVLEAVRATAATEDAMFIGYANDYIGYSLGEEDWYLGGYEASGALWGPRQGDYLAARTVEAFEAFADLYDEAPWVEPDPVPAFSGYEGYDLYVPETAIDVGTVRDDVPTSVGATDVVSFTVLGSDPWLSPPIATLEREMEGGAFAPVVRGTGQTVDSRSYDLWIDLAEAPTYADAPDASERAFAYTFHFPVSTRTQSSIPPLSGSYRFTITVPTESGSTTSTTGTFSVP